MDIKQRKILITGASRGIGRAIAEALLGAGASVVGIGRDFSGWDENPPNFEMAELDLGETEFLPQALTRLAESHSGIDGVVCNAGKGRFGSLEEMSPKQIREAIEINLLQHVIVARVFLPLLKKQGRGDLLFIGSEAALAGGPKGAVYSACKFALRGLSQALRAEASSSGVRVGIVNPGMAETAFFDELGFAPGEAPENALRPADVASAVLLALMAPPGTVFDEINLSPLKKVIRFRKPAKN